MRLDSEIERDVKDEFQWEPDLDATDIAVSVKQGVVTLAGFVRSYTDKYEAEAAAKRIAGVVGVANDLEVRMPSVDERPDPDIARDVVTALKAQLPISWENIKVIVRNGWVTLEGNFEWQYQKNTAETLGRHPAHLLRIEHTDIRIHAAHRLHHGQRLHLGLRQMVHEFVNRAPTGQRHDIPRLDQ